MSELLFGSGALWFGLPAVVGTAFFLGRVALMAIGGDADGLDGGGLEGLDGMDGLGDADAGFDDSGDAFQVISIQTIAAFMMGFGWGGLGAFRGSGLPMAIAVPVGIAVGVFMVWLLARVLRFVMGLQSSGTMPLYHALEATGTVYTQVPAGGGGTGEVRVVIGDRERYFFATTEGDALPRNTEIRIVRVDEDANRVEVERA
jgi:hypothetical protein